MLAHLRRRRCAVLLAQNGLLADNRRMAAGFMAGVTEALVIVTPFEVVKIRLQQQRGMAKEQLLYRVRV
jgi:solute carrier family 25 citrate transporter 1